MKPFAIAVLAILLVAAIGLGLIWVSWYQAGIKADVCRRNGWQVSQWEIFMGAPMPRGVVVDGK